MRHARISNSIVYIVVVVQRLVALVVATSVCVCVFLSERLLFSYAALARKIQ